MYSAAVTNRGTYANYARTKHGEFVVGMKGGGSSAIDTVLAGLCGCIAYYLRDAMLEKHITYTSFDVKAETDLTPDGTRFAAISVTIQLEGSPAISPDDIASLLMAAEKCQVHNTLRANSPISISLTVDEPDARRGLCVAEEVSHTA